MGGGGYYDDPGVGEGGYCDDPEWEEVGTVMTLGGRRWVYDDPGVGGGGYYDDPPGVAVGCIDLLSFLFAGELTRFRGLYIIIIYYRDAYIYRLDSLTATTLLIFINCIPNTQHSLLHKSHVSHV